MAKLKAPFALDRSLNTTEQTSRNIADVLAEELSAIITALGGLNFINYEVVEELPTTGISTTTIYLVPSDDPQSGNTYDEYINLNGTSAGWEKIGSTAIDLSGYYTSAETDALLDEKVDKDSFDEQTATDEFTTINGGLLSECIINLVPVQSGSGDPSPDNVRPISGHTQVVVGDDGKNRLPLVLADIKASNTSGTWNGNVYTINGGTITIDTDVDGNAIDIKANGTFTARTILNITMPTNNYHPTSGSYIINKSYQNASTAIIIDAYNNTWVQTLARSSNVDNVQFALDYSGYDRLSIYLEILNGTSANNIILKPMIRLASDTDPTFVPYNGYQVTVNLGGTYYSGTLDVATGVFVADKAKAVTPTRGALDSSGKLYTVNFSGGTIHNHNNTAIATPYVMCSHLDVDSLAGARDTQRKCICQYTGGVYIGGYVGEETALDNMLASADFSIVFELATPLTIQLSPTTVKALVGENHLSAPLDGQEITEVKYKKMFTFDDVIAYIQSLS